MHDLDSILFVIENPTRRRILQALVREPHYPLQLSKELGISQQAIAKNLDIMERNGLVKGSRESSNIGPERIVYRPTSEFTLTIDLRDGTFRTNLMSPSYEGPIPYEMESAELEDMRAQISVMDREIMELDQIRSELIDRRDHMIHAFMEGTADEEMDYRMRNLLYDMLDEPDWGASEISENLRMNENMITEMLNTITKICKGRNDQ